MGYQNRLTELQKSIHHIIKQEYRRYVLNENMKIKERGQ